MKVILVTSFAESFLQRDTLPALAARGVDVVARFEARHVDGYDLERLKRQGVELILHMTEVGSHSPSEKLSHRARLAGLPIKALSRKKASWGFLPPPRAVEGAVEEPPSQPEAEDFLYLPEEPDLGDILSVADGLSTVTDAKERALQLGRYLLESGFDRKRARLRDVVQLLVLGYGLRDGDYILRAVRSGRENGIFPRLFRIRSESLPQLVATMLRHELGAIDGEPEILDEDAGFVESEEGAEEDDAMITTNLRPVESVREDDLARENARLKARVADLERLHEAHQALRSLVRLGYMSAAEAAEKLFSGDESRSS